MFDSVDDSDISAPFSRSDAARLAARMGVKFDGFTVADFTDGLNIELEHRSATDGDPTNTAAIVLEHLAEHPHYYRGLKKMEKDLPPQSDTEPTDIEAAQLLGIEPDQLDGTISDIFNTTAAADIMTDLTKLATKLERNGQHDAAAAIDELSIRVAAGLRDWAARKMREWSGAYGKRVQDRVDQTAKPATEATNTPGLVIDSASGTVTITRRSEFLPKFKAGLITTMGLAGAIKSHFATDAAMLAKIRIAESATDGSAANKLLDIAVQTGLLMP